MRRVMTIDNQLQQQIEEVEPNADATVRKVAKKHAQYLKYVFGAFLLAAAGVTMWAAIPSLISIVTTAVNLVSPSSGATMAIIPTIWGFAKHRPS